MSKHDDEFDDELDDDYKDEDYDEDDDKPRKSGSNPFSAGGSSSASKPFSSGASGSGSGSGSGSSRFGDSSRLPGSPGAPRPGGGAGQGGSGGASGGSSPFGGGAKPSPFGSGSGSSGGSSGGAGQGSSGGSKPFGGGSGGASSGSGSSSGAGQGSAGGAGGAKPSFGGGSGGSSGGAGQGGSGGSKPFGGGSGGASGGAGQGGAGGAKPSFGGGSGGSSGGAGQGGAGGSSGGAKPSAFGAGAKPGDKPADKPGDKPGGGLFGKKDDAGAKPGDKPGDKPGGGLFGKKDDAGAKPGDKPGGIGGMLSGVASKVPLPGGRKDDAAAKPGDKPGDKPGGGIGGMLSGVTSKLPLPGGRKDDAGSAPASSAPRPGGAPSASSAPPRPGGAGAPSPLGGAKTAAPAGGDKPATPKNATRASTAQVSFTDRLKDLLPFGKKPDPKAAKARASKAPTVKSDGMSLDTKLDILGVALLFASMMIIFSTLSPNQGQITGEINRILAENFGWGAIAIPMALFAVGAWLLIRHFGDEAPTVETSRLIGLVMLYIGTLVLLQYVETFNYSGARAVRSLQDLRLQLQVSWYVYHTGGGYIGAELYYLLVSNVTEIGGFFVLAAWMTISLMLLLRLSAAELAIIVISVGRSFGDAVARRAQARAARRAEAAAQALVAIPTTAAPAIGVSKPEAAPLPPGKPAAAPSLPAPAPQPQPMPIPAAPIPEPVMEAKRSIPITQGGRTVTASFGGAGGRPSVTDPPPVDTPAAAASTGDAAAPAATARTGGIGGLFNRGAGDKPVAAPGTPADAVGKTSDAPAATARTGGIGGLFNRGAADASGKASTGAPAAPAANDTTPPATVPAASAAPTDAPARPAFSNPFRRGENDKPAPAAAPADAAGKTSDAPAATARTGGIGGLFNRGAGDKPAAAGDNPAAGTSSAAAPARPAFGNPLRRDADKPAGEAPAAPTAPAASASPAPASPTQREGDARTDAPAAFARPAAPTVAPPSADKPAEPVSASAQAAPAAEEPVRLGSLLRPAQGDASGESVRTAAASVSAPPPVRVPVDEPVTTDDDRDAADVSADVDLSSLEPARPKGTGPAPRPAAPSPFARPGTPAAAMPSQVQPPLRPERSLQERMAALRDGSLAPDDDAKPASAAPAASVAPPKPKSDEVDWTPEKASATPPRSPSPTTPPRPTPRIVAMEADEPKPADPPAAAADPAGTPSGTLTQSRPGIRPFGGDGPTPPPPPARTPAAPSGGAPAAFSMPERATPAPPPPRGPSFVNDIPDAPQPIRRVQKDYRIPDHTTLLLSGSDQELDHELLIERARIIEDTLASFGAPGRVVEVRTGPVITQFGVEPDYLPARGGKKIRVKVSAIAQLDKDLQLALGAKSIRIEAPVPGKGYVGIEVPNEQSQIVRLRDVLESEEFKRIHSPLAFTLGQSVDGTPVAADLTTMPHLLIAGTTGSGKSVCVNAIIASILIRNTPDRVKFIMVDPKRVELTGYNGIPHLVAPVVVELERIVSVLKWVTREMDERYKKFASVGARNIEDFNKHLPQGEPIMPYIVVIIDELADLMMLAPDETERVITRIAALARATGIHLVIATQRPSVDVVTGLIKANFPARVAFAVAGGVDSRVILDQPGAERLLGRGDMLYMSGDSPAPQRLQGVYVSDNEINNITRYWRGQMDDDDLAARPSLSSFVIDDAREGATAGSSQWSPGSANRAASRQPMQQQAFWDRDLSEGANNRGAAPDDDIEDDDDDVGADGEDAMYDEAVELVRRLNKASVSLLQRRLRIGYGRAARLIDIMEQRGVIGPPTEGSKPRDVIPSK